MKKAILSFGLALFAYCLAQAQPDPIFQHLPPDANTVIRVNLPVLASKIDLHGLLSHLPIKSDIGQALKNPVSAGIDLHQDAYIVESGSAMDSAAYHCIIVHLADSGQWVSYIRTTYPGARYFRKPGAAPAVELEQQKPAADSTWGTKQEIGFAWNNRLAVITLMSIPSGHHPAPHPGNSRSTDRSAWYTRKAISQSQRVLHGYPASPFTTNQTLNTAFSDDADLTSWSTQGNNFMVMSKVMAHIPGNHSDAGMAPRHHPDNIIHVRFENGRLLITSAAILPPDTAAILARVMDRPFNENLAARLPQGNLLGMAAMHIDPSALLPFVKNINLDSILHKKGPDLYRLLSAFKGDFLLAAIAPQGDTSAHPKANFYFISTINDRSAFLDLTRKAHLIRDSAAGAMPDTSRSMLGKLKTAYTIHDSICVISRSRQLADSYFTTTPHTPGLLSDEFRSNFFTLVVDIKAVQAFLQSGSTGNDQQSAKAQKIHAMLGQFDRLIVTMGLSQGNQLTSSFEIRLADQSLNSLKLFSGFFIH